MLCGFFVFEHTHQSISARIRCPRPLSRRGSAQILAARVPLVRGTKHPEPLSADLCELRRGRAQPIARLVVRLGETARPLFLVLRTRASKVSFSSLRVGSFSRNGSGEKATVRLGEWRSLESLSPPRERHTSLHPLSQSHFRTSKYQALADTARWRSSTAARFRRARILRGYYGDREECANSSWHRFAVFPRLFRMSKAR